MIFNEIYGIYYNTVSKIIAKAIDHPLTSEEIRRIAEENAYGESALNIAEHIAREDWLLLHKDGTTPIKNKPDIPLTTLQKRWLKAIALDPRVKLFENDFSYPENVQPLFRPEDIVVFYRYNDGDPYGDEKYIRTFRMILDAIKKQYPLRIFTVSRHGKTKSVVCLPHHLEYSEKDDKFRLVATGRKFVDVINLGRIVSCAPYEKEYTENKYSRTNSVKKTVTFSLTDERNALERVLLHFAHFEKEAEKTGDKSYRISIVYNSEDETELLIRILSFGPNIKVTEPESFVQLIKQRLIRQKSCGL